LTTPRSSNHPSPGGADPIATEIEVNQLCALRQHSCKTLCPIWSDPIVNQIGDAEAESLAGVLAQCAALAHLNIRFNGIESVRKGRLRAWLLGQASGLVL